MYTYFRLTRTNACCSAAAPDHHFPQGGLQQQASSSGSWDFRNHFPELNDPPSFTSGPTNRMTRDLLPSLPGRRPVHALHSRLREFLATFCGSFAARNVLGEADEDYARISTTSRTATIRPAQQSGPDHGNRAVLHGQQLGSSFSRQAAQSPDAKRNFEICARLSAAGRRTHGLPARKP